MHIIPLSLDNLGSAAAAEAKQAITGLALPAGAKFKPAPAGDDMNVILETILVAVASKEVLAAVIAGAAAIWAARITAKATLGAKPEAVAPQPTLQIVLIEGERGLPIDDRLAGALSQALPDDVEEVIGVRFGAKR
ncbi:MAG: hypothetical protein ABJD97_02465 [Betaproteobacteria bacterium]